MVFFYLFKRKVTRFLFIYCNNLGLLFIYGYKRGLFIHLLMGGKSGLFVNGGKEDFCMCL